MKRFGNELKEILVGSVSETKEKRIHLKDRLLLLIETRN